MAKKDNEQKQQQTTSKQANKNLGGNNKRGQLGPLLLTWFNFNPSMDK